MLNYLKKFALDILPSVAATIIGAYIVNHYIATKPGTEAPVAAAVSAADPKTETKTEANAKPAEAADVGNLPAAGIKAKGVSEKSLMERTAAERPTVIEKAQEKTQDKSEAKADVKSGDAPVETASIPAEPRRHAAAPREKEKIRVVLPSLVQPVTPAAAPVTAAPAPAPPVEAAVVPAPEERRDANDLARAAIERLRGNGDTAARAQETSRAVDTPRVVTAPAAAAPAVRPLPPPIMVSAPPSDPYGQGSSQPRPPYAANAGAADPSRPTPPAEIPLSRPLDLRAEAAEPSPSVRERTQAAAEDVLSTAKSLFHAVLPK
ncbi:hypothetical protein [Afipia sp. GAS231]|uniref:hypothetical protein n=1 Tax=Afipia sp. GAS231 TaxID=1882747 RepID=UPI00087C7A00|nr:hypothetical protein [Afipia sp. GAS231]SDN83840.1 hypothetical protein SAMN05444050_2541 [Afipia sp. GAS231]